MIAAGRRGRSGAISLYLFFLMLIVPSALFAQGVDIRWELEARQAVVGQRLRLSVELAGYDKFELPELVIPGVEIHKEGGGPRNSTSISIINGKTSRVVSKSWVGSWSLKASRPGRYRIPAQRVSVDGKSLELPALEWEVMEPLGDERFVLRQHFSQEVAVPGVPVDYELVLYFGANIQDLEFTLPLLEDPRLEVEPLPAPQGSNTVQVRAGGRVLEGVQTTERLDGRDFAALRFRFRVTALDGGTASAGSRTVSLDGTMASLSGAVDTRVVRGFFGNTEEPVFRNLVAKAPPVSLAIRALPKEGRPEPFSGLIGQLSLSWEGEELDTADASRALSRSLSVGEPLRLGLRLAGVLNRPRLDLDAMVIAALEGSDFRVASDAAAVPASATAPASPAAQGGPAALEDGDVMVRSFVIRPRRAGSLAIPALALNYFNPQSGRYETARSEPIRIEVRDPFGGEGPAPQSSGESPAPGPAGAGTAGAGSAGVDSAAGATRAGGQAVSTRAGVSGIPTDRLARMHPNGRPQNVLRRLPWWLFALPGLVAALALSLAALWRHHPRCRLYRERRLWRRSLAPLNAHAGRAALEEGRTRLEDLLKPRPLQAARLAERGVLSRLSRERAAWDAAYFAGNHEGEDWAGRWESLVKAMEEDA